MGGVHGALTVYFMDRILSYGLRGKLFDFTPETYVGGAHVDRAACFWIGGDHGSLTFIEHLPLNVG